MTVISFVVIYDSNFSHLFIASTVGSMMSMNLFLMYTMVKFSCDAHDKMDKVWRETIKIISSPNDYKSESFHNLSIYVSNGKVSRATVWNMFKIKRTVLLSFASQVIPLTIMIITTWHGFKPKEINTIK